MSGGSIRAGNVNNNIEHRASADATASKNHQKKKKKMWMRRLFVERQSKGLYNVLVKDLMLFDHVYFFKALKMNPTTFEELLSWIGPFIQKSSTQ